MQQVVEGKASASDGTTLKGCSGDIRLLLEQDSPPDDLDVMALFSGRWPNKCSFSSGPLDLDPAFFHTRSFCQVLESRLKVSFVWGEVVVAWMRERERESARARARPRARDDQTAGYCCPTAGTDVREHAYFVQNTVDVSELHRYLISCLFFFVCSINSALEPFRDPFISLCWVNSWQFVCVPSVHLFLLQPEVSMASRATGHIISL